MITLHHLENSRSQRILWLLEELAIPFKLRRYERDRKTNLAPDELLKIHPLGKSPVISDDDRVIAESGPIVEHLIEAYGQKFIPQKGTEDYQNYRYFMHYAEGSFMPLLIMSLIFHKVVSKSPFLIKPITQGISDQVNKQYIAPNISRNLDFMEKTLEKTLWFAGDKLSGADFMMWMAAEGAEVRRDLNQYPKLQAFLKRVRAREAFQSAIKKGGPFSLKNSG